VVNIVIEPRQYKKKLPGKSNAHLIEFDDGNDYVVKFLQPGFEKSLANEWIGYCLGRYMGVSVPFSLLVEIPPSFLQSIPELGNIIPTKYQFASKFVPDCVDAHEAKVIRDIINKETLASLIVVDYWLMNRDRTRKNILLKEVGHNQYQLWAIDHSEIIRSYNWKIQDLQQTNPRLIKSMAHQIVASFIENEEEFWHQVDLLQKMPALLIEETIDLIPEDWMVTKEERKALTGILVNRRKRIVPKLIHQFIKKIYLPEKKQHESFFRWNLVKNWLDRHRKKQ